jgi:hypothetical protein
MNFNLKKVSHINTVIDIKADVRTLVVVPITR